MENQHWYCENQPHLVCSVHCGLSLFRVLTQATLSTQNGAGWSLREVSFVEN